MESYFALRSVGIGEDRRGVKRLTLNGKPYFMNGLLDQGWWPDGLYTRAERRGPGLRHRGGQGMGFNTLRKHVKVEPARWYYHCDRLECWSGRTCPTAAGATPP